MELLKRALSGFVLAITIIFASYYSVVSYFILLFIIMMVSVYEFSKLTRTQNFDLNKTVYPISLLIFSYNISFFYGFNDVIIEISLYILVFSTFLLELKKKNPNPFVNLGSVLLVLVYVSLPLSIAAKIPFNNLEYNPFVIIGVFILIWVNDSFAYLLGRKFGKRKLIERVSPNKTIEGFIGGLVATYISSFIFANYYLEYSLFDWFVISSIIVIFGVFGDLIESMFKRKAGIKDTGRIMPGHGGFLDRFDSFIFASPFIYIYIQLIQL